MSDDIEEMDLFSFAAATAVAAEEPAPPPAVEVPAKPKRLPRKELIQLTLGFLATLRPEALALQVPARYRKYQVTAAGFWRGEGSRYRQLEKTAVVVLYEKFDHCFADCADRDAQLAVLHSLCAEKEALEASIRETEPELASQDDLFNDFRSWDYASSRNPEYRKLRRKLEHLQHTLHQGSRLEHIRATGVADLCYLAVPAGLVAPEEVAYGWGLLYLYDDRTFRLIREAEVQSQATVEGRQVLAQNIAVAAAHAVRFSAGVELGGTGTPRFRRFPRKKAYRR